MILCEVSFRPTITDEQLSVGTANADETSRSGNGSTNMEGGSRSVSAGSPNGFEGPRVMSVSLSRIGLLPLERTEQSALFGLITMLFFAEKPHPITITWPPAIWKDLVQSHIFLMRNYIQFVRNSDTISFLSVRSGALTVRPTRPIDGAARLQRAVPAARVHACVRVCPGRSCHPNPPPPPSPAASGPARPSRARRDRQRSAGPVRSVVSYRSKELA